MTDGCERRAYLGPRFDGVWYKTRYSQLLQLHRDPLTHYLAEGRARGCKPNAAVLRNVTPRDPMAYTLEDLRDEARSIEASGIFDAGWYASCYGLSASDALTHYLVEGAYEGLDPNPVFSTRTYFDLHGDVGAAGVNPLWHYLTRGYEEGRDGALQPALLGALEIGELIWRKGIATLARRPAGNLASP